eukprot:UN07021
MSLAMSIEQEVAQRQAQIEAQLKAQMEKELEQVKAGIEQRVKSEEAAFKNREAQLQQELAAANAKL